MIFLFSIFSSLDFVGLFQRIWVVPNLWALVYNAILHGLCVCFSLFSSFYLSLFFSFFLSLSFFYFCLCLCFSLSFSICLYLSVQVCLSLLLSVCVCVLQVKLCISCCKQQKHLKVSRFNFYWFALNWYRSSFVVVIAFLPFSENCSLKVNVDYKSELVTFTVFEFKFWLLCYVIYNLRLVKMENVIW